MPIPVAGAATHGESADPDVSDRVQQAAHLDALPVTRPGERRSHFDFDPSSNAT
jgi:hypothetical protein